VRPSRVGAVTKTSAGASGQLAHDDPKTTPGLYSRALKSEPRRSGAGGSAGPSVADGPAISHFAFRSFLARSPPERRLTVREPTFAVRFRSQPQLGRRRDAEPLQEAGGKREREIEPNDKVGISLALLDQPPAQREPFQARREARDSTVLD